MALNCRVPESCIRTNTVTLPRQSRRANGFVIHRNPLRQKASSLPHIRFRKKRLATGHDTSQKTWTGNREHFQSRRISADWHESIPALQGTDFFRRFRPIAFRPRRMVGTAALLQKGQPRLCSANHTGPCPAVRRANQAGWRTGWRSNRRRCRPTVCARSQPVPSPTPGRQHRHRIQSTSDVSNFPPSTRY